ncbi:hypothetical protein OIU74_001936, partial [Salix koriyanagi]
MDSGLEKADRSISSVKGRRWAKPLRADSVILLRNARKACGGSGGWEPAAVVVVGLGVCDREDWRRHRVEFFLSLEGRELREMKMAMLRDRFKEM